MYIIIRTKGSGRARRDVIQCEICNGSLEMKGGMEGRLMR